MLSIDLSNHVGMNQEISCEEESAPSQGLEGECILSSSTPCSAGMETKPMANLGLRKTKSEFLLNSFSSASSTESETESTDSESRGRTTSLSTRYSFGARIREYTQGISTVDFTKNDVRAAMEPYVRRARLARERVRHRIHVSVDSAIASAVGVPYTPLRKERPFLYDEHSFPLHEVLAHTLQVSDLQLIHLDSKPLEDLLQPLRDRKTNCTFQRHYDNFVTTFCIPLLHSVAMASQIFHHTASPSERITYRYQAFPTVRIHVPGSDGLEPTCDTAQGHSIGCLTFHIPLTPSFGNNAVFVESYPGREDWHPLTTKAVGLGYLFDGARCLYFASANTTSVTRVSLEFRVLIFRESQGKVISDGTLCSQEQINDLYNDGGQYYDNAFIDLNRYPFPGMEIVNKTNGSILKEPDPRVGPPFM